MRNLTLIFVFLLSGFSGWSQLHCTEKTVNGGGTEKRCLHSNKKTSTLETWDKEHRWGNYYAYDSDGKEIFHYDLRRVAGHASVSVQYFANGQVKRCEYSSAPDGGIQFYHIISEYNEQGKQTSYMDLSQPDGHPTLIHTQPDERQAKPSLEHPKPAPLPLPPANECAVPMRTVFQLKNRSANTVSVLMKTAPGNTYLPAREEKIILKPMETMNVDSVLMGGQFMQQDKSWTISVLNPAKPLEINPGKAKDTSPQRRVLSWIITEE